MVLGCSPLQGTVPGKWWVLAVGGQTDRQTDTHTPCICVWRVRGQLPCSELPRTSQALESRGSVSVYPLHHGGELATKVGYFGVKSTNVRRTQMGTKPAKVGRLASTLLKYVGSAQRSAFPAPPPFGPPNTASHKKVFAPQNKVFAVGGPKLLKWGLSGRGSNLLKSDPPLLYARLRATSTTPRALHAADVLLIL
jgi:hypothetical protein